ncbi:MAG: tryptophan synthase subunit beta like protein [Pseudomonadota bacterium]|nr:tryptophan synthase subunit beta like protein [Pseudomonadota bacterium]
MYVKRNAHGDIELVSRHLSPDCTEYLAADAREWRAFLAEESGTQRQWHESDQQLIRVLEDLIEALIESGTLDIAKLPEAARSKLADRRLMRYQQQVDKAQIELRYFEEH